MSTTITSDVIAADVAQRPPGACRRDGRRCVDPLERTTMAGWWWNVWRSHAVAVFLRVLQTASIEPTRGRRPDWQAGYSDDDDIGLTYTN